MHRDLKPENILFRKPNEIDCVIADLGLGTRVIHYFIIKYIYILEKKFISSFYLCDYFFFLLYFYIFKYMAFI